MARLFLLDGVWPKPSGQSILRRANAYNFLAFAGLTFASFLLSWLISFSNLHATGLEFPVPSVLSPHRAPAGSMGTTELAEWVEALAQVLVQQLGLAVLC